MNGADLYKLTVQDWLDMNTAVEKLNGTTERLSQSTDRLDGTLVKMNETLGDIRVVLAKRQCVDHDNKISGLQKLMKYLWLFVSALVVVAIGGLVKIAFG